MVSDNYNKVSYLQKNKKGYNFETLQKKVKFTQHRIPSNKRLRRLLNFET